MNNKHIACTILGLCIAAMLWFTLQSHGKMTSMSAESSQAETAAMNADSKRQMKDAELVRLRRDNAPLLNYLAAWKPYFDQTSTESLAETKLTSRAKDGGMVMITQALSANTIKDAKLINKTVKQNITFEDDYVQCLQWLGNLEEGMPTARISGCDIAKGQSENNIRMELVIEVPVTEAAPELVKN
ncbi:hypothetical protein OAF27_00430 [Verrucomicrobiales bacterium]|nr:hypothetical protein [Verrucomicrobiales bacterium]